MAAPTASAATAQPTASAATAQPTASAEKKGHGMILTGLMLGVLLFALDQTVVGTSLPKIVADLGGFEHFSWLITAYLLASTVVIPIAGKLSDLYGRRPVFLTGMGLFLLGSLLCGTAQNMTQLILYRAIQGLGGGALFPVAIATIADLYAPSERGRVQGIFGAVFGLASVIGPFLGGWIVDNLVIGDIAPWRWVFYVNLPVGLVAIPMVAIHFPRQQPRDAKIDYAGIATLTVALVGALLVAVWGGQQYEWTDPIILGLAALALVSLAAFLFIETRASEPIIPLSLFKDPIFAVSAIATVMMGASMFGVLAFMPTFMQGVVGISATNSGAVMIPLSLALMGASVVSGRLLKRFGYKIFVLMGTAIAAVGFVLLSLLTPKTTISVAGIEIAAIPIAITEMIVIGVGLGFTMQTMVVAVQNAIGKRFVGVATSTLTLLRSLGSTFGVAVLGAVLNARLTQEMPKRVPKPVLDQMLQNPYVGGHIANLPNILLHPEFTSRMPAAVVDGMRTAFNDSISTVFLIGFLIADVAFMVSFALRAQRLKTSEEYHNDAPVMAEP